MKVRCVLGLVILFCLLYVFPIFLYAEENVMTAEKIISMKSISDVQLSPGGNKAAYVLRFLDKEKHRFTTDIYISDVKTGESVQMTYHPENDSSPRWSPDGSKIAFLSNREEKNQVWLISTTGGEAYQLTRLKDGVSGSICWSPDGQKIAFLTPRELSDEEKKAKDEKRDEIVIDETMRLNQLAIIDVDSGDIQRLTDGKTFISDPSWSPDSKKIAFTSRPTTDTDDLFLSKIFIVQSSGGTPERLTNTKALTEMSPQWSPDGRYIAFSAGPGYDLWADPDDVYCAPADGGSPVNLTAPLDRSESLIRWANDSRNIVFSFDTEAFTQIGKVDVQTKKIDILISKEKVISSINVSPSLDIMAFVMTDPENPGDLWLSDINLKKPRLLVQSNPDIIKIQLGKTKIIQWKSFDGKTIEGILVLPVNYKEGQRVPLIVEPHGGPAGVRTVSFNPLWQMFAGAGYAVFAPNFRGSGNYGREFVRSNIGDWGGGDYRDIMAGVDDLIKEGIADEAKLGVEGWSYGGFMTNWIITHTDRFKAAVSGAGLSNLESFYGTTDIQGFMEYYHKGFPWVSREIYRSSSPLTSSFKVNTPVLILHGEEDTRVPISQSEELYQYLKNTGVNVKFVRYPRESHGLREPNHQLDRYTRMLEWFNTYLLGKEKQKIG
jgi:dipeptidyl aminopeptidase/acylaminoacyl peptidase